MTVSGVRYVIKIAVSFTDHLYLGKHLDMKVKVPWFRKYILQFSTPPKTMCWFLSPPPAGGTKGKDH